MVIPLLTSHAAMLGRTLLYTAVTRARRLVVIVGQRKALSLAVSDWRREPRATPPCRASWRGRSPTAGPPAAQAPRPRAPGVPGSQTPPPLAEGRPAGPTWPTSTPGRGLLTGARRIMGGGRCARAWERSRGAGRSSSAPWAEAPTASSPAPGSRPPSPGDPRPGLRLLVPAQAAEARAGRRRRGLLRALELDPPLPRAGVALATPKPRWSGAPVGRALAGAPRRPRGGGHGRQRRRPRRRRAGGAPGTAIRLST